MTGSCLRGRGGSGWWGITSSCCKASWAGRSGGCGRGAERRLWELELLGTEERQELLGEGVGAVAYPREARLEVLFAEQVRRRPAATAVVYEEERVSYGELNGRAQQVAQRLRRLGVGVEEVVGLCLGRSVALIVGLVGIVKAGGAYLALDGSNPEERLRYMVADAGVRVVLTSEAERERVEQWGVEALCMDEGWEASSEEWETAAAAAVGTAENLAYVIYTSGSTGQPKGVAVSHRAIVRLLF